ncbi:MAG: hypothetical protein KGY99_08510 [Phycisphaerae bacterium]|nr:hypothetical protein [Phycisphaerae bacterium]
MHDRRAVITGVGVVTPVGVGVQAFADALESGRSAVRDISLFDASGFPCRIGGELESFSARKFVPKSYRKSVKVMARDIEIAVAAADLAFRDAGLTTRGIDPDNVDVDCKRLGCNIGAGLICTDLSELGAAVNTAVVDGTFDLRQWGEHGLDNLTPLWLLKYLPNMLACHVTIIHGCEGSSNNITCGDASAHLGVGESAGWIARGAVDAVVAGGAESKLNPMGVLRQSLLHRLRTDANDAPADACRPFDADAGGTVIGEGGGLLILEAAERAQQRGAAPYAELAGFGAACDPQGIAATRPNVGSLDLAVSKAMADADVGPDDVDAIFCQGSGVPGEDRLEAQAWAAALGDAAERVPACALTGAIGTLFAGAGGAALAAAAVAMKRNMVPGTVNFSRPAEGVTLNLSRQGRSAELNCIVTAAYSIGGQSAACVLKRPEA